MFVWLNRLLLKRFRESFPKSSVLEKAQTEGKIFSKVTVLVYQRKDLGTLCEDFSPMERKCADVVDVWNLLKPENKSA